MPTAPARTALLAACMLPACMSASGRGDSWRIASLGTDLTGLHISGPSLSAASSAQSPALRDTLDQSRRALSSYLLTDTLKHIATQYRGHQDYATDAAAAAARDTPPLQPIQPITPPLAPPPATP